jgi:hypothetical protein
LNASPKHPSGFGSSYAKLANLIDGVGKNSNRRKEKDPVRRANMARRLAELAVGLAEREEARKYTEQEASKGSA